MKDVNGLAQPQFEERVCLHERLCILFGLGMDEPQCPLRRILGLRTESPNGDDPTVLGSDIGLVGCLPWDLV